MTVINRTPHDIVILPIGAPADAAPILTLAKADRGEVARVEQTTAHDGWVAPLASGARVPIGRAEWGQVVGLPDPDPNTYHIVSVIVVEAALDAGRTIDDLLVPGDQVRDGKGRIVGCRGLIEGRTASPVAAGRRALTVADAIHRRLDPEAMNMRPDPDALVVEAERMVSAFDSWVKECRKLQNDGGWSYDGKEPHGMLRVDLISICRRAVTDALADPNLGADEARSVALSRLLAAIGGAACSLPPGRTGTGMSRR